jgi:hypothetical protein
MAWYLPITKKGLHMFNTDALLLIIIILLLFSALKMEHKGLAHARQALYH